MPKYRVAGAVHGGDKETIPIVATHPAPEGTRIVYAQPDGTHFRSTVVLWGVLEDGVAVPITLSGVWDGCENENIFVLHPDGSCSRFDDCWAHIDDAVEARKSFA